MSEMRENSAPLWQTDPGEAAKVLYNLTQHSISPNLDIIRLRYKSDSDKCFAEFSIIQTLLALSTEGAESKNITDVAKRFRDFYWELTRVKALHGDDKKTEDLWRQIFLAINRTMEEIGYKEYKI